MLDCLRFQIGKNSVSRFQAVNELAPVIEKIELIEKAGFGEVRILIRNGFIYRIQTIEDKLVTDATDSAKS